MGTDGRVVTKKRKKEKKEKKKERRKKKKEKRKKNTYDRAYTIAILLLNFLKCTTIFAFELLTKKVEIVDTVVDSTTGLIAFSSTFFRLGRRNQGILYFLGRNT